MRLSIGNLPEPLPDRLNNITAQAFRSATWNRGVLDEDRYRWGFSSVNLALTEGKWIVEISLTSQNQATRPRRLVVGVTNPGVDQYLDP